MDNKYFDKLFKKQLEGLPQDDFPFDDTAWDGVESVLNKEGILPPQSRFWKGIFPISLIALLLLSNIFISWKYYQSDNQVTKTQNTVLELEQQLLVVEQALSEANDKITSVNTPDLTTAAEEIPTVNEAKSPLVSPQIVERVIEKVVYVPVPYQGNTATAGFAPQLSFSGNSILNLNRKPNHLGSISMGSAPLRFSDNYTFQSANNWINDLAINTPASNIFNMDDGQSANDVNDNGGDGNDINIGKIGENNNVTDEGAEGAKIGTSAVDEDQNIENEILETLEGIGLKEIVLADQTIESNTDNFADTTRSVGKNSFTDYMAQLGYAMEVSNYSIGFSNGYDVLYTDPDFSKVSIRAGLVGELNFSDRIKIGTTIEWKQTILELNNIEDRLYPDGYFSAYPNAVSGHLNHPDDKLTTIKGQEQAVEIALFAKYYLRSRKQFSPYFGGGVKGVYDFYQILEYKYLIAPELEVHYEGPHEYPNYKAWGVNTVMGMIGAEYDISKRMSFRADLMYNHDFKAHRFTNTQYNWFSGNVGLLYHLK